MSFAGREQIGKINLSVPSRSSSGDQRSVLPKWIQWKGKMVLTIALEAYRQKTIELIQMHIVFEVSLIASVSGC